MKYIGSKSRIAKEIIPIMLSQRGNLPWIEPFVGGGNTIDKVDGIRVGADINRYAIEALISIRDCLDELPKSNKEFTEQDYFDLRKSDKYKHKGYAGFAFSYGARWLCCPARDQNSNRDFVAEAYRNAQKQSPLLQGVKLICCDYKDLPLTQKSLIYCDPPYKGTSNNTFRFNTYFDHDSFWQWCRGRHKEGHIVFVSEYQAPNDFKCVWQKEIISSLTKNTGHKRGVEKLFVCNL